MGAESNRKLSHLFIPGITASLVPEFVVEDLPLGVLGTFVPEFAVEDLPLGRTATMVPDFAVVGLPLAELQPWFLCL